MRARSSADGCKGKRLESSNLQARFVEVVGVSGIQDTAERARRCRWNLSESKLAHRVHATIYELFVKRIHAIKPCAEQKLCLKFFGGPLAIISQLHL
eukprot:4219238-Pleurochrysis_carterae.AAC.1